MRIPTTSSEWCFHKPPTRLGSPTWIAWLHCINSVALSMHHLQAWKNWENPTSAWIRWIRWEPKMTWSILGKFHYDGWGKFTPKNRGLFWLLREYLKIEDGIIHECLENLSWVWLNSNWRVDCCKVSFQEVFTPTDPRHAPTKIAS